MGSQTEDMSHKTVQFIEPEVPRDEAKLPENSASHAKKKKLAFSDHEELPDSQDSIDSSQWIYYNEALSPPPAAVSHRARMIWLQEQRDTGIWVKCDSCDKWGYMTDIHDPLELPKRWYCEMNPDTKYNKCGGKERKLRVADEEDLIHNEYSAGSLVWAKMAGYPWWPAMVDDCPDVEQYYWLDGFSDIPTYYNVTFFDSDEATRGWIAPESLKPYSDNIQNLSKKYAARLKIAKKQADHAKSLSFKLRLRKYSFVARFSGRINTPKKVTKAEKRRAKRKYFTEIANLLSSSESESDSNKNSKDAETVDQISSFLTRELSRDMSKEKKQKTNGNKRTSTITSGTVVDKEAPVAKNKRSAVQNETVVNKKKSTIVKKISVAAKKTPGRPKKTTGIAKNTSAENKKSVVDTGKSAKAIEDNNMSDLTEENNGGDKIRSNEAVAGSEVQTLVSEKTTPTSDNEQEKSIENNNNLPVLEKSKSVDGISSADKIKSNEATAGSEVQTFVSNFMDTQNTSEHGLTIISDSAKTQEAIYSSQNGIDITSIYSSQELITSPTELRPTIRSGKSRRSNSKFVVPSLKPMLPVVDSEDVAVQKRKTVRMIIDSCSVQGAETTTNNETAVGDTPENVEMVEELPKEDESANLLDDPGQIYDLDLSKFVFDDLKTDATVPSPSEDVRNLTFQDTQEFCTQNSNDFDF